MLGTPMAVMYVVNAINYALMKRLIQIDNIGLVNIVAGRRICQEFVQTEAEPQAMAAELEQLLFNAEYRREMQINLRDVREKMGTGGASGRVAQLIRDMLFDV